MLQSKNVELESVLDYLRAQPEEIDVDEAVQATNPLYNQLVRLSKKINVSAPPPPPPIGVKSAYNKGVWFGQGLWPHLNSS